MYIIPIAWIYVALMMAVAEATSSNGSLLGALMTFVNSLQASWNISIFHYRNHGADVGRIVVGVQVPPAEREQWQGFLAKLAYRYWDETANPAYALFLGDRQPAPAALVPGQLADDRPVG